MGSQKTFPIFLVLLIASLGVSSACNQLDPATQRELEERAKQVATESAKAIPSILTQVPPALTMLPSMIPAPVTPVPTPKAQAGLSPQTLEKKYSIQMRIEGNQKWDARSLATIDAVLTQLPATFYSNATFILATSVPKDCEGLAVEACAVPSNGVGQIWFTDSWNFERDEGKKWWILIHELTHVCQFRDSAVAGKYAKTTGWEFKDGRWQFPIMRTKELPEHFQREFFWDKLLSWPPLSGSGKGYVAKNGPKEDMADATAMYVLNADGLKRLPDNGNRYNFIKTEIFKGKK